MPAGHVCAESTEQFGFQFHSERQIGPHLVARYEYDVTTTG